MALIPLIGGAYVSRSPLANMQRCVNLFPEKNPEDSPVPVTHYQTPGTVLVAEGPLPTAWRGLYPAPNGSLYGVLGNKVYKINSDFVLTELGTIGSGSTPVSMADNTAHLMIVDGSSSGWTVDLSTDALAVVSSPNFYGGDFVGYLDTFFVLNRPGTREWYASDSNAITFPALSAARTGASDLLVALIVNHLDIWLIGQRTTEIWSLIGGAGFPFQRVQGVFIQHGCVAPRSVATWGLELFWLSQDNNGQALVLTGTNYAVRNITTPALSFAISKYQTINDAIGYVYQQGTHVFYVLTFPTADRTWVYDNATGAWHEWLFVDENGVEHRHRSNCTAFAYSKNIVGDFQNGKLYELDINSFTDDGTPIVRRRGFPHVVNDGLHSYHRQLIVKMEVGTIEAGEGNLLPAVEAANLDLGEPERMPMLNVRWSNNGGTDWESTLQVPMGATGEYGATPSLRDLGIARDRVYEIFWSENCEAALNGVYLDADPLEV